jgi:hypothetical protein
VPQRHATGNAVLRIKGLERLDVLLGKYRGDVCSNHDVDVLFLVEVNEMTWRAGLEGIRCKQGEVFGVT